MLRVDSLESRYGRVPALKGVSLEIEAGELVALVGANGAGKTTLLRTLSGVHPAAAGRVFFDGDEVTALPAEERVRRGMIQVPEGRQVFGALSVEDNLRLGAYARGRERAAQSLEQVYEMFPVLKSRRAGAAGTLSGGQQQMLALGRALMGRPRLLLLDEPSMGLAPRLVEEIYACIVALRAADTALFLVDQNARAALRIADRAYVLETGKVVLAGSGAELLSHPQVQAAYLGL